MDDRSFKNIMSKNCLIEDGIPKGCNSVLISNVVDDGGNRALEKSLSLTGEIRKYILLPPRGRLLVTRSLEGCDDCWGKRILLRNIIAEGCGAIVDNSRSQSHINRVAREKRLVEDSRRAQPLSVLDAAQQERFVIMYEEGRELLLDCKGVISMRLLLFVTVAERPSDTYAIQRLRALVEDIDSCPCIGNP